MIQQVLLIASVMGAIAYLSRSVYRSFKTKNTCATGCAKCAEATAIRKT